MDDRITTKSLGPFEVIAEWMANEAIKTSDPSSTLAEMGRIVCNGEADPDWAKVFLCVYAKARLHLAAAKPKMG